MSIKGFGGGSDGGSGKGPDINGPAQFNNRVNVPIRGGDQLCAKRSYFGAYQSPRNGNPLDPTEGYVFFSGSIAGSGVAGQVVFSPRLSVPQGYYMILNRVYCLGIAAVAADGPGMIGVITPLERPPVVLDPAAAPNGFLFINGPGVSMNEEQATGAGNNWIEAIGDFAFIPSNFGFFLCWTNATGGAFTGSFSIAGILLKDDQNGDTQREIF